ncbi:MAG: ABC transporter substrate-binding protein [Candidatus Bathyarchaeota archaeon]|nr:ABC transporter substrate-binding protein [Candidatus Bathyarchaeota archaeon]
MNKNMIAGIILIVIIASSIAVGYSQNWFQNNTTPQPTPTPTTQQTATTSPTEEPTATANPTATTKPTATATAQPTAKPTTQPTTVAALNLVLEVYGNANMDDKVDQADVTYVSQIINGAKTATQFADANRDGVIDSQDITQINAIINGQATQIHMLDGNKKNITVSLPADRIVIEYIQNAELVRVLEIEDKVVGIDFAVDKLKDIYFPGNTKLVSVGNMYTPDYEAVLSLNPDILLTFSNTESVIAEKASKLPGVDVVFLGLYYPNVTHPEDSRFLQGILKAGYIFNKVSRATEYANWLVSLTSTINSRTSAIADTNKHSVLIYTYPYTASTTIKEYATIDTLGQVCILAGGANVAASLPTYLTASSISVDLETVLNQNPEYIFLHCVRYTFAGGTNADPAQGMDVNDITSIKTALQQYLAQPAYANITAVKNNHVYIMAGDFRNNAMGGVLGAVYMANVLYPDLFTDLNAQTIHQQYITKYLRLDYNLDNSGVFLYPGITLNGDIVGIPNGAT